MTREINTEPFVTAKEVAKYFALSESTIRKATKTLWQPLPHHRVPGGRSVRYRISEVSQWFIQQSDDGDGHPTHRMNRRQDA